MPFARSAGLLAALTLLIVVAAGPHRAAAEDDKYDRARAQHPELFKVYYDENVLEYCGLLTHDSALGFVYQRDDLLAAHPVTEEAHHDARVAGSISADMAFSNHGLGGQKLWCKTEGMDAFNRFIARYRAQAAGSGGQVN